MSSGQRKIRLAMIEIRIPIVGRVTRLTCGRESRGGMVRIVGSVIIRCMAGEAGGRCSGKLSIDMTLLATRADMSTRQRESGRGMIEGGRGPSIRSMAFRAGMGELCRFVIR